MARNRSNLQRCSYFLDNSKKRGAPQAQVPAEVARELGEGLTRLVTQVPARVLWTDSRHTVALARWSAWASRR